MLQRLTPDQVSLYWKKVWPYIEASLPPIASSREERGNNILAGILANRMQLWLSYEKGENGDRKENGIMTTALVSDECSGGRSLLIYSAYATEQTDDSTWVDGYKCLVKFAMANRCETITCYTENKKIIKNALLAGAKGMVCMTFPILEQKEVLKEIGYEDIQEDSTGPQRTSN